MGSTGEDDVGSSSAVGVSRGSSRGRGGRNLLSVPNSASSGEVKPSAHRGTSGVKSNKFYTNLHLCKGFQATVKLTEKTLRVLKKWKNKKPKTTKGTTKSTSLFARSIISKSKGTSFVCARVDDKRERVPKVNERNSAGRHAHKNLEIF